MRERLLAPPLSRLRPGLADIVARCLWANPGRRYRAPADLAADLRRHLAARRLPFGTSLEGELKAAGTAPRGQALDELARLARCLRLEPTRVVIPWRIVP